MRHTCFSSRSKRKVIGVNPVLDNQDPVLFEAEPLHKGLLVQIADRNYTVVKGQVLPFENLSPLSFKLESQCLEA